MPNLERALAIMEILVDHHRGLTQAEIGDALGFSKNSVFRITKTLLATRYLSEDPDTRRLRLSHKMLVLGCRNLAEVNLIENSLDVMRSLRDEVKETVCLGTIVGSDGVVIEQVLGAHPFKFTIDRGMRLELHVSALGKAILAFFPPGERDRILASLTLTHYNDNTLTTVPGLLEDLRLTRDRGYSLDRAEQLHGVHCIGAPVFDHNGYPVAAIWTTGPSDRLRARDFGRLGETVANHARQISMRNGHDLL